MYIYLFLLGRPPWPHIILIIVWRSSNIITAATGLLDYLPLYLGLCATFPCTQMMNLAPLSPPLILTRFPCPPRKFARAYYISLLLLPPIRPFVVNFAVHLQQRRLSPAIRQSEVFRLPTDWQPMPFCPWLPVQCTDVWRFPRSTCAAGSNCLGVGGGA